MKKLYTFLIAAVLGTGINAQYLDKNFDDMSATSGGWSIQEVSNVDGITTWTTSNAGGAPTYYGLMKNYYTSANHAVEAWLISPAMDLSGATTPTLSFKNACNYNGDNLQLQISTNYDGSSAPSSATWTNITSSAAWSTGGFAWVASGNIDLSAYNTTGVYIAFVYTGSASDGKTWEVEDILVNEGGAVLPTDRTVYEIQGTFGTADESAYKDQEVATGGIVSAVRADGRYYIQSGSGEYSGVYVYDNNTVAIGDSVTFYAFVTEFNGLTELTNISNFNVVSSGNTVPQTICTTAQSMTENYEGVLVTMQNATCTQATNGNGEWIIDDNSGPSTIDDYIYAYTAATGGPYEVTGVVDYAFGNFKVQPRMASDIVTSVTIPDVSIYQIQGTFGTADSSAYHGQVVNTGGIVTAIRPTDSRYYIQAGSGEYSGIYVYDNSAVTEGDSVTLTAVVTEFNGLTELTSISNLNIVSSGNTIPQTIVTTGQGNTENYEGVLVTVVTTNCTMGTNGFGEWILNDGSGDCKFGDFMYAYVASFGGTYTATGVVDYAFNNFLVQPRYAADILDYTAVEENNTLEASIYPNPANDVITINAEGQNEVIIYSVDGKICFSSNVITNNTRIDVADFEAGNYIITIKGNNGVFTQKLTIE